MNNTIKDGPLTIPASTAGGSVHIHAWTKKLDSNGNTVLNIEDAALKQAYEASQLPCVFHHVSLMADSHVGYGVNIGCVLPLKDAICPNAVGVDIACGLAAINTGILVKDVNVDFVMQNIAKMVPHGNDKRKVGDVVHSYSNASFEFGTLFDTLADVDSRRELCETQLGTLGGGNHFLSMEKDETGNLWFMVHSGSRGFGAKIADHYHKLAVSMCEKWHTKLPNTDLAFLPTSTDEGREYIHWQKVATEYAFLNRKMMLEVALMCLHGQMSPPDLTGMINIHHNYAALENHFGHNVWVHRKGATLARKGTVGIIPGSMCTKSYIVTGLGNPQSFDSCSHGAGRNFSRTEAKKRVAAGLDPSQEVQLGSVKLYGVTEAHDELGSAYKNLDEVMINQKDLVQITTELTPVATLKG